MLSLLGGLSYPLFFFFDDAFVFAKATQEEFYALMRILNKFSRAYGQRINCTMSGVVFNSDIQGEFKRRLVVVLTVPIWYHVGSYLGVLVEWGRSKTQSLIWIKERMLNKLDVWKEKLLNDARKEVLINAVIQAIPFYVMSIMNLRKTFCRQLCSMVANLWWRSWVRLQGSIGRVGVFSPNIKQRVV